MSTVTEALSRDDGNDDVGEVDDRRSVMAAVSLQQYAQRRQQVCGIPFEFVDDDEMAAIESAMLQAHSVSTSYRSMARPSTIPVCPSSASGNLNVSHYSSSNCGTQSLPTNKSENSFVDAVVRSTSGPSPSSGAQNGLPFSRLEDVASCQLGEDICTPSHEMLSDNYLPPVLSVSDEPSPDLLVNATISSFVRGSVVQGLLSGDSQDIEDLCGANARVSLELRSSGSSTKEEATRGTSVTLLHRKSGRGLAVTDFTASEWCEKQLEFSLNRGKPEQTPAMRAGSARHVELEKEVVTRVDIEILTKEDMWAVRLLNFISGARQLLSEGLTRELPVVGLVGATWVVGIIDEIRLVQTEYGEKPYLVDTKTRRRRFPPSEPQKRNARLQLMCYKLLWDSMVEGGFPSGSFFQNFRLNPLQEFCQDVKAHAASLWVDFQVQCLQDLLPQIMKDLKSQIYSKSVNTLLLRYEWQEDLSLLGEDEFSYEHDWLVGRWMWHSMFWSGHRAATYVPEDEAWKCRYCSFASVCLPSQQSTGEDRKMDMKEDVREDVKDGVPGQGAAD